MIGQFLWRGRLPVALTAVAATVGTVLAGGAAHAAEPAPPDFGAVGKAAQARVAELREQTTVSGNQRLATDELTFGDLDGDAKPDMAAIDSDGRF